MSPVNPVNGEKQQMSGPDYVLPQGQGRVKIIAPAQMSAKWRAKYGSIYRVWNGTWPEMCVSPIPTLKTGYATDTPCLQRHY